MKRGNTWRRRKQNRRQTEVQTGRRETQECRGGTEDKNRKLGEKKTECRSRGEEKTRK